MNNEGNDYEISTERLETSDVPTMYSVAADVDVQVQTAKNFPRNMRRAIENALTIVTRSKTGASEYGYALPRAGKMITGPSVHLARVLAQTWGNLRVEARVVEVGGTTLTSEAVCWDLESNVAVKVSVKRSIMTKRGRMNDDMIVVTGNAANAIAFRNAVFSVIPKGVVDELYDAAQKTITGDLSDEKKLVAKRTTVLKAMTDSFGVTEEEILAAIGKGSVAHIGKDEIAVLIGIGQAIRDGDTTVAEAFGRAKPAGAKKDAKKVSREKELDRLAKHLATVETADDLTLLLSTVGNDDEMRGMIQDRMAELGDGAEMEGA
mgnify:CR=1 FL=1